MTNLDGLTMTVSATAATGVVDGSTVLRFSQRGERVFARYAGGRVARGWLVGRWNGTSLDYRYAQREHDNVIHGGRSVCEVERLPSGLIRIVERFAWSTRPGTGVNVFDEVSGTTDPSLRSG